MDHLKFLASNCQMQRCLSVRQILILPRENGLKIRIASGCKKALSQVGHSLQCCKMQRTLPHSIARIDIQFCRTFVKQENGRFFQTCLYQTIHQSISIFITYLQRNLLIHLVLRLEMSLRKKVLTMFAEAPFSISFVAIPFSCCWSSCKAYHRGENPLPDLTSRGDPFSKSKSNRVEFCLCTAK